MRSMSSLFLISALVVAGCASNGPTTTGKHLVYRDASGAPEMQIDYPNEDLCHQVEAVTRKNAKCQKDPSDSQLMARATLRYDPPGMLIEGHYRDMARCQAANSSMAKGVQVVNPCRSK